MTDDDMNLDGLVTLDESDWKVVRESLCKLLRLEPENSWHWLVMSIVDARLDDHRAADFAAEMALSTASRTSVVAKIIRTMSSRESPDAHTQCDIPEEAAQIRRSQAETGTSTACNLSDYCCDDGSDISHMQDRVQDECP